MSNSSILSIRRILLSATTPSQSGYEGNCNEGVFNIFESSKTGVSKSDGLVSYLGNSFGGVLLLCRDTVGVFYSYGRLGWLFNNKFCLYIHTYIPNPTTGAGCNTR